MMGVTSVAKTILTHFEKKKQFLCKKVFGNESCQLATKCAKIIEILAF